METSFRHRSGMGLPTVLRVMLPTGEYTIRATSQTVHVSGNAHAHLPDPGFICVDGSLFFTDFPMCVVDVEQTSKNRTQHRWHCSNVCTPPAPDVRLSRLLSTAMFITTYTYPRRSPSSLSIASFSKNPVGDALIFLGKVVT